MIERRPKFWYWFCNVKQMLEPRVWYETRLLKNIYVNFDNFQYRINGVVYKKYTKQFQEALNKERLWDLLK